MQGGKKLLDLAPIFIGVGRDGIESEFDGVEWIVVGVELIAWESSLMVEVQPLTEVDPAWFASQADMNCSARVQSCWVLRLIKFDSAGAVVRCELRHIHNLQAQSTHTPPPTQQRSHIEILHSNVKAIDLKEYREGEMAGLLADSEQAELAASWRGELHAGEGSRDAEVELERVREDALEDRIGQLKQVWDFEVVLGLQRCQRLDA